MTQNERSALMDFVRERKDHWPWWICVDDKYRNWDSIIPALNEETTVCGDITDYFVDKLVAIANTALPFIDDIEAQPDSPRSSSR